MAENKKEEINEEIIEEVTEDVDKDESMVEESTKDVKESDDSRYLRLLADFQNYKKRIEKEKNDIYNFASESIVKELLIIVDNFERALESECLDSKYAEGMTNIFKLFSGILTKNGLEEIPALGEEFDPNVHSAVATEDSEEYESGKVSFVLQKGYKLKGKVIRVAMVKVAN